MDYPYAMFGDCNFSSFGFIALTLVLHFYFTPGIKKAPTSLSRKTTNAFVSNCRPTLGFSTMASSNFKESDCDNDRQPEIAIWPPKPEVLICVEQ